MKLQTIALGVVLVIVLAVAGWYIVEKEAQITVTPTSTHNPQYNTMLTDMFGTSYTLLTLTPHAVTSPPA